MEFQSGMRAATANNVTVHAMVYFIDFFNLKKITFIEIKTSTQTALWKEQETRLCCKEIWQEYGTFCEIMRSKKMALLYLLVQHQIILVSLKKLCEKCMKVM